MQIGAFELHEPVPELKQPHLLISLRPWIDVGSVGSGTLQDLEEHFDSQELGRLRRPSVFYDMTRYRPQLYRVKEERHVDLPNTIIRYARTGGENDFIFVHALEPHLNGEDFVDSVLELISYFGVVRYCQVGAMYGSTPHSRSLIVTGQASEEEVQTKLRGILSVRRSNYEGPTTVMAAMTDTLQKRGVHTLGVLVQLPPYVQLEEDSNGQEVMLRLIKTLYDLDIDLTELRQQGQQQYREIDKAVQADPQMRSMVRRLEESYDAQVEVVRRDSEEDSPPLAPDVERFLSDLERRRHDNG